MNATLACLFAPPSWRGALAPCAHHAASREHWLAVPLDWAAPATHPLFKIRYHVDDSHFDAADSRAPVFVKMGGEGTTANANCGELAARHGALCVSLEHRMYGLSVPARGAGGVSDANLRTGLSVENALADAAAVVDAVRRSHGPPDRPIVAFGGSYAGALCAWFRQAYSAHVDGCVASSGVVNAILDFDSFDVAIGGALERMGPPTHGRACAATLRAVAAAVDRALDSGSGRELRARFNATGLRNDRIGDVDLAYALADAPAMAVQYGAKRWLCAALGAATPGAEPSPADDDRLLGALAALSASRYGSSFAASCFYSTDCIARTAGEGPSAPRRPLGDELGGQAEEPHAEEEDDDVTARINARSWRFQKCSQLAYLQRAPQASAAPARLRSRRLTLSALLAQCALAFGARTRAALPAANAALNARFGGAAPASGAYPDASGILFLGFSDDPWQAATVPMGEASSSRTSADARRPSLGVQTCFTMCDGCGHCGAGVPAEAMKRCSGVADAFVRELVETELG
ncbi:hypothetical protein KFE25_000264 [Diacronema lutheri]|uniref:Thymus-specific serine protease n=1 Tax=Diacronema lutheri TaxID=2081491 RepID=A0A8J5X9A9_DIALT|nr:hypothetical protein KFE25_000264 [Diacronema lutheri]